MTEERFIYIKGWDKFQHPDVVRRKNGMGMPWIRDYTDQLDNQQYLDLPLAYRAGLQDIRRLVADIGQGRCSARADYLQRRCSWPAGWAQKIIKRLSDEGFIEVRASKMQASRLQAAGQEEIEIEKESEKEKDIAPQAARQRNTQWDALVEIFGYSPATKQEQTLWGKLSRDLAESDATLETITEATRRYRTAMPNVELTPPALVKHYQRLMAQNGSGHVSEVGAQARRLLGEAR